MQGIQMGTLDIFRGNASSLPNYGAELIGTTGLPYVFKDMAQFEDVAESSRGRRAAAERGRCQLRLCCSGLAGRRSSQPVYHPEVYERLGKPTDFTWTR